MIKGRLQSCYKKTHSKHSTGNVLSLLQALEAQYVLKKPKREYDPAIHPFFALL